MGTEDKKANELKIVFSLISLLLMLPPLINLDAGYYRTLFIFLVNRVIDMVLKKSVSQHSFFEAWDFVNQWFGTFACALAFCSIAPDFYRLFENYKLMLNIVLFIAALSCVLKDIISLITISVQEKRVRQRIRKNLKK